MTPTADSSPGIDKNRQSPPTQAFAPPVPDTNPQMHGSSGRFPKYARLRAACFPLPPVHFHRRFGIRAFALHNPSTAPESLLA